MFYYSIIRFFYGKWMSDAGYNVKILDLLYNIFKPKLRKVIFENFVISHPEPFTCVQGRLREGSPCKRFFAKACPFALLRTTPERMRRACPE
ncbi:MAG: hypothetical protein D6778_09135 [Nitrospirae bacterium]|nr:MAG: hypothetical protein D6778_09135 [Nitrospirota bacterium]